MVENLLIKYDNVHLQMMPLTQMNTHLMCPKCCPNELGVPFLSMFNLPFSKAARNTIPMKSPTLRCGSDPNNFRLC